MALIAPILLVSAPTGSDIFYLTLLLIFVAAIVTAMVTTWSRDKCLKFFRHYHVTLEQSRGQTVWGMLKVFSTGLEVMYDRPYVDTNLRKQNSFIIYQQEMDQLLLGIFRYSDELSAEQRRLREKQIHRTFNPGPTRRMWRKLRSFINTLRDAFNAAIGAIIGQYQRMNPAGAMLSSQGTGSVTQIGQTLLGKLGNAYEPILEQYIGRPVIVAVADPLDPNNSSVEFSGFLADYTQQFIAVFNTEHKKSAMVEIDLPDVDGGPRLPPLPAAPAANSPPPQLTPPMSVQQGIAIRVDGPWIQLQNTRQDVVVLRSVRRGDTEPTPYGAAIPPQGTLQLLARDVRGGKMKLEFVRWLDVLVPRKSAIIRHAGEIVEPKGLAEELTNLPLIPSLFEQKTGDGDRGSD